MEGTAIKRNNSQFSVSTFYINQPLANSNSQAKCVKKANHRKYWQIERVRIYILDSDYSDVSFSLKFDMFLSPLETRDA